MKTRVLLSSVLLLVLGMTSSAQDKPAVKPEAKDGGEAALRLLGETRNISVEEMIRWWCEYEKVNVMYQPTQIASCKVTLVGPSSGTEIPSSRFAYLVSDALEQFRLVVVEISENRYSIVRATEAITHAPVVDVATARKTPGWKWIAVQMPIRHGDANSMRAVLQNVMSRAGGSVNPNIVPPTLIVCDRADRLQRIINAIEAMEAEGARRTAKTYTLPAGINAASAAAGFATIIGERYNQPTPPAAAVNETTVVVRATPEQLVLCDELFKQLVAKAEEITAQSKVSARRYDVPKSPEQFVESLEKLFGGQISAAVVPGADAVIVKANNATHDEVKAALELMK
ncbi:MAG: hypothetical protein BroJett014_27420 [Planctomycetota bacterium]|nr:MAG: hypothetical protein BroJett014_27420 [Planctomycetota bacterium]